MSTQIFRAGVAQVEITPALGTIINGDFISHYACYIHDPLYAKGLVMQSGNTNLAIVVVDICVMDTDFINAVKAIIEAECGIPPQQVLISSTHTHAAGSVTGLLLGAVDSDYRKKLPALITLAVKTAIQNLAPAEVAFGSTDVPEHVVCRRYLMKEGFMSYNPVTNLSEKIKTNPAGAEDKIVKRVATPDKQVCFLAVRGTDGRLISVVANYALHYVGDWANGTITADYFGVFSKQLHAKLNADDGFIAMMTNGASGDVNIWDFCEPNRYPAAHFEKSELIGTELAGKVQVALQAVTWQKNPPLSVAFLEQPVEIRLPTNHELERSKKLLLTGDLENVRMDDKGLQLLFAREQILLNEFPSTAELPLQVLKIGDGIIGAVSCEIFSETGLWLKQYAGSTHYFTVSMANGYHGYLPPAHEIEAGGYETWRCRSSYLHQHAEQEVREQLLLLVNNVNNHPGAAPCTIEKTSSPAI